MARSRKQSPSDHGHLPKKSLGQNFLTDNRVAARIVAALELDKEGTVLEIGPGRGALTDLLAAKAGRVVAVEIDRELAPLLEEKYGDLPSVRIVQADFLETAPEDLIAESGVKVAANLPYYISTAILRRLFDNRQLFDAIVVMLQKEVAERLVAPPGTSERGYLTVFIEHGFTVEKLFDVPPGAFRPVPKVESAVIRLKPRELSAPRYEELFRHIVSSAFLQKRKTLANNLKSAGGEISQMVDSCGGAAVLLESCGISPRARAEELSKDDWDRLVKELANL